MKIKNSARPRKKSRRRSRGPLVAFTAMSSRSCRRGAGNLAGSVRSVDVRGALIHPGSRSPRRSARPLGSPPSASLGRIAVDLLERNDGAVDQAFTSMLEIDGNAIADYRL